MLNGDFSRVYKYFEETVSLAEFKDFFDTASSYFVGMDEYKLTPVGWKSNYNNGVSSYTVTFRVTGGGKGVVLTTTFLSDGDVLAHLNIVPATTYLSQDILPWQILLVVFALASVAFIVWMVVDCAKSGVKNKLLYIILILACVRISFTFGEAFNFDFAASLLNYASYIKTNTLLTEVNMSMPVGAVVYFFLRKRLKASSAPSSQDPIETEFVDKSDSDSTNV
jgi:glucan phosphoethanolaminetransferase (alkaline phosphatase superfamily)